MDRSIKFQVKKLIGSFCLLIVCVGLAGAAQQSGRVGVGVMLGDLIGPTLKLWTTPTQALNLGLGFEDNFTVYADYDWHSWSIFTKPKEGKLAGHFAFGAQIEDRDHADNEFGIRTLAGIDYWIANQPIELYFEAGPVFVVSPDTDVDVTGGIGVRYYFN